MNPRALALLALLLCAAGWWYSPLSPRTPASPALAAGQTPYCPPPPGVHAGALPLQSAVPASMQAIELKHGTVTPLAGFSIDARVLSRLDYRSGREARFSPTDLALGWGRMREDPVLEKLDISQSSRWYRYRWRGDPPIPPAEIARSSANMHMVPADAQAAAALRRVRAGDDVRIDGWLVEINAPDGWRWRSSLSREDTGNGACELIYVCSVSIR